MLRADEDNARRILLCQDKIGTFCKTLLCFSCVFHRSTDINRLGQNGVETSCTGKQSETRLAIAARRQVGAHSTVERRPSRWDIGIGSLKTGAGAFLAVFVVTPRERGVIAMGENAVKPLKKQELKK
jgi:hypothetical protein